MIPLPTKPNRWRPITLFNLLVGLLFSLSALGQPAFLKEGLVAYYPFNGNAKDASGKANNVAVLNGVVYSSDRFGVAGYAVEFQSNQRPYIDLGPGIAAATIGDLTQSIWIKSAQALEPSNIGTTKHIVLISRFTKGDSGGWPTVEINANGNLSTELTAPSVGGAFSESPSKDVLDGKWHLITAIKSGNSYLMYLDGILRSSSNDLQNSPVDTNKSSLWLGANYWNDYAPLETGYYKGEMDDVRIYNRALSGTEVKALYDYESTPPDNSFITNGLVAYYPFNGNANDESGNGNHLKTSGLPKYEKPNRNGNVNSSVDLSGGANYFTLDDKNFSSNLIKSPFTIVYWRKGDGSDSAVCVEDSGSVLWSVGGKGDVIGADENVGLTGERVGFGFRTGLSGSEWNCVSIVWNGNSSKAYSNGKAIGYGYLPPLSTARDTHRLYIGADPYAGFDYYNGQVDDIRIYNRALSDGELKALYNYESTPPDNSFITNGLIAYYPFNGNANDESGSGNNGAVQGATLIADRNSSPNKAYRFDGSTKIDVGNPPTDEFDLIGDSTLSLWVSANKLQYQFPNCFIGKDVGPGTRPKWVFGLGADPNRADVKLYFDAITPGNERELHMTEFVAFPLNKYTHLVIVKNGKNLHIFKDGAKVYSGVMKINLGKVPANLTIGYAEAPTPFAGSVDDVRIYNRALFDGEVKALFDYESTPTQNNLNPRTATATAQVVNGFVVGATITDGGYGYISNPVVAIIGGGGTGAKATATQFNGVVTSITITNPGSGYTSTPTITIAPPPFPPRKATSTAQVVNGFVVGTKITDGGFGYETPPAVLIVGGGGSGATAVATVANGVVTAITIGNPGSGYTSAPLVRIASPPFAPKLAIETSKVYVRMSVVLGRKYQLEASTDLNTWTTTGPAFIAQDEELAQEFDVNQVGRYFRINQVP